MKEDNAIRARFAKGTRVRVRSVGWLESAYSTTWRYQNMTGEIADSFAVAGYLVRSWWVDNETPLETIHLYRVHLDSGAEVEYLTEDCLERLAGTGR